MKTLKFTIGIQGSGKSTYTKDKSPVVSTDELRKEFYGNVDDVTDEKFIFDTAIKRIVDLFEKHNTVYFDATMVETKHRITFLGKIKELVADVELIGVVFSVDPEVAKARIMKDLNSGIDRADSVHYVDEYYEYFQETMALIEEGSVLFKCCEQKT